MIDVPAVAEPHQGTSYNPPVSAHQELLRTAHEIEEQRAKTAEEHKIIRDRIAAARHAVNEDAEMSLPIGMTLDTLEGDPEVEEESEDVKVAKPQPERKTKQQRRKAEKQKAEVLNFLFQSLVTELPHLETGAGRKTRKETTTDVCYKCESGPKISGSIRKRERTCSGTKTVGAERETKKRTGWIEIR